MTGMDRLARERPPGDPHLPIVCLTGHDPKGWLDAFAGRLRTTRRRVGPDRAHPVSVAPHVVIPPADPAGRGAGARPLESDLGLMETIVTGLCRAMPRRMGRLDLWSYLLVRMLVEELRAGHEVDRADVLPKLVERHRAFRRASRQVHYGDLLDLPSKLLAAVLDRASGSVGLGILVLAGLLFVQELPGVLTRWSRLHRLGWLTGGTRPAGTAPRDVRDAAVALQRTLRPDPHGPPDPAAAREVLVRALLHDLDVATRPRRLRPRRRERVTPFLLLFEDGASVRVDRFVAAYAAARTAVPRGTTLVVVAGKPACLPPQTPAHGLDDTATLIDNLVLAGPGAEWPGWLVVDIHPGAVAPSDPIPLEPRLRHVWWPATLAGVAAASALGGVWWWPSSSPCPGIERVDTAEATEWIGLADGTGACTFHPEPGSGVERAFRQAERDIVRENRRAVNDFPQDPLTVVYFAPLTPGERVGGYSPGTLRELRAIAVAQRQVNDEAEIPSGIPLRVLLANPGSQFQHGEQVVEDIAEAAADDPRIVGVVGIGQSRETSRRAVARLEASGLPVIAGAVTGDDMLPSSSLYFQVAPTNDRVARMIAAFAAQARIVGPTGAPRPAQRAVIVTDHTDEYAWTLAEDVEEHLTGAGIEITGRVSYPAEDRSRPEPPGPGVDVHTSFGQLGRRVCELIVDAERDIVVYTARSRQLAGFLEGLRDEPACPPVLSMITGSDTRDFLEAPDIGPDDYGFVRLFYPAFAAALAEDPSSALHYEGATELHGRYSEDVGAGDLSRDMSGVAVTYDALLAFQHAANDGGVTREAIVALLRQGVVSFNGASGYVDLDEQQRVPRNKPVLMLRADAEGAQVLMICGQLTRRLEHTRWGSALDPQDCPRDG